MTAVFDTFPPSPRSTSPVVGDSPLAMLIAPHLSVPSPYLSPCHNLNSNIKNTKSLSFFHAHLMSMVSSANDTQILALFNAKQATFARVIIKLWIDQTANTPIPIETSNDIATEWEHILNSTCENPNLYNVNEFENKENLFYTNSNSQNSDIRIHENDINETSVSSVLQHDIDGDIDMNEVGLVPYVSSKPSCLLSLPTDVWMRVAQFVDQKNRITAFARVDTFFYRITNHPSCWNTLQISSNYFTSERESSFCHFLIRCCRALSHVIVNDLCEEKMTWSSLISTLSTYCAHVSSIKIRAGPHKSSPRFNILEPLSCLNLHEIRTNCVVRPSHLCSFLVNHPKLTVLKASVRFRTDWSQTENETFWKIPSVLPNNLEIFFLPGHHDLPEPWIISCLSRLHHLQYLDFFIVNDSIPRMTHKTITCLANNCQDLRFCHLHLSIEPSENSPRNTDTLVHHGTTHHMISHDMSPASLSPYVPKDNLPNNMSAMIWDERLATKMVNSHLVEITQSLQSLFAQCTSLSRVYLYLPMHIDRSCFLHVMTQCVKLPSNRRCRFRMDQYSIGSSSIPYYRCVFKIVVV